MTVSRVGSQQGYDVIVVGAGHNGLVAANYLARAGLRVLVLERRNVVGGLCVTEEIFPGFFANVCSNSAGSLEPKIIVDLELLRFGLEFADPDPYALMPFPDGRALIGWRDRARGTDEVAKFSRRDLDPYYNILSSLGSLAQTLNVSFFEPAPTLDQLFSRLHSPEQKRFFEEVMFGNIRDFVDARLESEELKAVLGLLAIQSNFAGPSTPGTPYLLLHRPLSLATAPPLQGETGNNREIGGEGDVILSQRLRATQTPHGGMGAITQAMFRSLLSVGGTVRTNACVSRLLCTDQRVRGVVLASGEEIGASVVVSNVNPKATLLDLVPADQLESTFLEKVRALSMEGVTFKAIVAMNDLPRFAAARSSEENLCFSKCGFRMAPSLDYMERAWVEAKSGRAATEPMIWGTIVSAIDPQLAPPGKHIMSLSVFPAPYHLAEGDWDLERERFGRRTLDVLATYMPNLPDIVADVRFVSPRDLEREFGLTEGNATHGDMVPSRLFGGRPLSGCSNYCTPIEGLYLCGAGTWPGGFVSGVPGHNASRRVLADLGLVPISTGLRAAASRGRSGGVWSSVDQVGR